MACSSRTIAIISVDAGVTCSVAVCVTAWPEWYWVNRNPPITLASAAGRMSSTNLPAKRANSGTSGRAIKPCCMIPRP